MFESYLQLIKPSITKLVVVTTTIGFLVAKGGFSDLDILFYTLLGTALTCGGSAALNNYVERDYDALMKRTACRAIPKGKITPADALGFGLLLVVVGCVILAALVNLLTAFLALMTAFLYVLVYTPLKRITWLNTFVGAIPGALPPLGGWTAATGELGTGGWLLFAILFFWQMPHFYAIAWMYKDDYANAGYKMISYQDPQGKNTFVQIILFTVLLLLVSLTPIILPKIGFIYLTSAALLGLYFLKNSIKSYSERSLKAARGLLRTSVIYLPLLLTVLVIDGII